MGMGAPVRGLMAPAILGSNSIGAIGSAAPRARLTIGKRPAWRMAIMSPTKEKCPPLAAECPYCGIKNVAMEILYHKMSEEGYERYRIYALAECGSCKRCVLVNFLSSISNLPMTINIINNEGISDRLTFKMLPSSKLQGAPPDTDEDVAHYYKQGEGNLPDKPDAAVAMFRVALEVAIRKILIEAGGEKNRNLYNATQEAHKMGLINDSMQIFANDIRNFGNGALHGERVSKENANEVKELINIVLQYLYTLPAAVKRRHDAKQQREGENDVEPEA